MASLPAMPSPLLAPTEPPPPLVRDGDALWRWDRTLPSLLARHGELLAAAMRFEIRALAPVDGLTEVAAAELLGAGVPATAPNRALAADIGALGGILSSATGCDRVELRIEAGAIGMCPVFHQDHNLMRLLCAYAGPGTEWLPEDHLDRSQLGLRGRTPAEANQAIAVGPPRRAGTGEVLVMAGGRYADRGTGLVHRSPSRQLGPRLLVAMDPVG